jgi:hypothetical protein
METKEFVKGRLKCVECIYNSNCEEINDRCVANDVLDGEEVHIKKMEGIFYDG